MITPEKVENLFLQLQDCLPEKVKTFNQQAEDHCQQALKHKLVQLGFITQDVFNLQQDMLKAQQAEIELLKKEINALKQAK